ncbi:type I phosphomannose isomerase catalytic subunit [Aquimarina sp. 2201CG5-10]|uniref:type I phosphomannose isomerase catalytic subunit n=1 Tax=Aquimarina callyspongiae TaxID=3098150 RepID=UPI002AB3BBC6|nr:type I phosphomannose isomerase catalytic subunit [Aquimarina sp. 2201CG5-10]MDY8135130.1 type I phosphomannose isomerase catalytic subunit [Aquimarina sp. 2201CG5-10]
MELYPLKFSPLFKYRIWGGEKLKTVLEKKYEENNIGESWEISDVENDETVVSEGDLKGYTLRQLIKEYRGDFLGNSVYEIFKEKFPLLIKFIDAQKPLSIQVHPDNDLAKERHNSFGKNEMWYVMQADKDAKLIVGFNQEVNKDSYTEYLDNGKVLDILNEEEVASGDAFYIPTGRVHAIGSGVLLAEIQQTSNITYRIYDYDRVDSKTGKTRELHTELALDAIDYSVYDQYKTNYTLEENTTNKLITSPYFKTNIFKIKDTLVKDYSEIDSFVIYMCVDGNLTLTYDNKEYLLKKGETLLLPAIIKEVVLTTNTFADFIEVTV